MFLSLHDKFIWFQVVLIHDIVSRHFVGIVAINFVEFGSLLLKISEIFQRKKYV